jgi:hypothetical protein
MTDQGISYPDCDTCWLFTIPAKRLSFAVRPTNLLSVTEFLDLFQPLGFCAQKCVTETVYVSVLKG